MNLSGGDVTKILRQPNAEVLEAFSDDIDTYTEFNAAFSAILNQRKASGLDKKKSFDYPPLPDFRTCDDEQIREFYELYIPTFRKNRSVQRLESEQPLLEAIG